MSDQDWIPTIHPETCTGCGECITACPVGALAQRSGRAFVLNGDACTYCGDCEMLCPAGAIALPYQVVMEAPR